MNTLNLSYNAEDVYKCTLGASGLTVDTTRQSSDIMKGVKELLAKGLIYKTGYKSGFGTYKPVPAGAKVAVYQGNPYFILESYKGKDIVSSSPEDLQNCMVLDAEAGTLFIVGLDDSKRAGFRTSYPASIEDAKEYIDYVTAPREEASK